MVVPERALVWFLRITAVTLMCAAGAVIIPQAWMNAIHEGIGLGPMPDQPLVGYMARSLSSLYTLIGSCFWYLSRDIRRYLPLLKFSLPWLLTFSCVIILVDAVVAMPLWWTVSEGVFLFLWVAVLWWLVLRVDSKQSKRIEKTIHDV